MTKKHLQYLYLLTELFTEDIKFIRETQINRKALIDHFFLNHKKNLLNESINSFWNKLSSVGSSAGSAYQVGQIIPYLDKSQLVNASVTQNNSGTFTTELRFVSY